jgi:hypothetical protein
MICLAYKQRQHHSLAPSSPHAEPWPKPTAHRPARGLAYTHDAAPMADFMGAHRLPHSHQARNQGRQPAAPQRAAPRHGDLAAVGAWLQLRSDLASINRIASRPDRRTAAQRCAAFYPLRHLRSDRYQAHGDGRLSMLAHRLTLSRAPCAESRPQAAAHRWAAPTAQRFGFMGAHRLPHSHQARNQGRRPPRIAGPPPGTAIWLQPALSFSFVRTWPA